MDLHNYRSSERVEVTIRRYPDTTVNRWVRRGRVVRTYDDSIHVRFDDSGLESAYAFPAQKDWIRKLSLLELIAEAAND